MTTTIDRKRNEAGQPRAAPSWVWLVATAVAVSAISNVIG